jgi:transcriptional regulator with XRE-family HTH domain
MGVTAGQVRAARGLIGWSQEELATQSKIGRATIADFESGKRKPYETTLATLCAALESAGVIFVEENGEGPGVRLRKSGQSTKAASIPVEDLNAENDE